MASATEIAGYAYDAGIRNVGDLTTATAIALAESSGNPSAVGDVALQNAQWGPSIGLWQIRSLKAEQGKGSTRDGDRLKDPVANARAMFEISKGGKDWRPWTTFPLRSALFLPVAGPAAVNALAGKGASAASGEIQDAAGNVADTAASVAGSAADAAAALRATYEWISDRNNAMRIVKVIAGGALLVGGLYLVTRPVTSKIEGAVTGTVGKVARAAVMKGK